MRKRDRELRESRIWATYVHKGTISISVSNVLKYETFRVIVDHGIRSVGVCPDPIGRPPEFSVISRGRVSSGFFWSIHRRFLFLPSTRNLSSFIFFFFRNDKLSSISVALDMFEREREREKIVGEWWGTTKRCLFVVAHDKTAHTFVSRERDCSFSFFQWTKYHFLRKISNRIVLAKPVVGSTIIKPMQSR